MTPEKLKESSTTDGKPPRVGFENADAPAPVNPATGQHEAYWVLSEAERARGFVRPVRQSYRHATCGTTTKMSLAIAETYARQPNYYGATFCVTCGGHLPVGEHGEFTWMDGNRDTTEKVGT
jgi:hypothetical protein